MRIRTALLSVALLPLSVLAQTQAPSATAFEKSLLNTLHQANLTEISAGQLAESRGTSSAIRQFGMQLVNDHSRADTELTALAVQMHVTLAAAAPENQDLIQLNGLQGDAFDRAFVGMMVHGHNQAVSLVKDALPQVNNAAFKAYLQGLLPTLQSHLDMAVSLSKNLRS